MLNKIMRAWKQMQEGEITRREFDDMIKELLIKCSAVDITNLQLLGMISR